MHRRALCLHRIAVAPQQGVHACLFPARFYPNDMHAAGSADADFGAGPAEHDQWLVLRPRTRGARSSFSGGADRAQRQERFAIATVRGRAQQEHVGGGGGRACAASAALRVAGTRVSFVEDDEIPGARPNGRQDLGPLDVVD